MKILIPKEDAIIYLKSQYKDVKDLKVNLILIKLVEKDLLECYEENGEIKFRDKGDKKEINKYAEILVDAIVENEFKQKELEEYI